MAPEWQGGVRREYREEVDATSESVSAQIGGLVRDGMLPQTDRAGSDR